MSYARVCVMIETFVCGENREQPHHSAGIGVDKTSLHRDI